MWPFCGDLHSHSRLCPQPVLPCPHECLSAYNRGDLQVELRGGEDLHWVMDFQRAVPGLSPLLHPTGLIQSLLWSQ